MGLSVQLVSLETNDWNMKVQAFCYIVQRLAIVKVIDPTADGIHICIYY